MRISPEAIYNTIYVLPKGALRKELISYLRRGHRRRRRRKTGDQPITECKIEDMVMIDERPSGAENRLVPGHWEGDLLVGKNRQSALGSLTERTTRYTFLVPLTTKRAPEVSKAFAKALQKVPRRLRLSLTYDQGREMSEHKRLTRTTKVRVYFAHKASPWERGTNENTNGLVRQFFPKGTDFSKVSRQEIGRAERLLNGRPRKVLGYKTPDEAFKDCCVKS
jgi:IS30 family transposase